MTLQALLSWANRQWVLETPELQHAVSQTDEGGAPEMKPAAASYLGLLAKRHLRGDPVDNTPDDPRRLACRLDEEGKYRTPLRCAIERVGKPERRRFLRDLVPELYRPSDIAAIHGIPPWCAGDVMHRSLSELRRLYREEPEAAWISGRSDAQRSAEEAA